MSNVILSEVTLASKITFLTVKKYLLSSLLKSTLVVMAESSMNSTGRAILAVLAINYYQVFLHLVPVKEMMYNKGKVNIPWSI